MTCDAEHVDPNPVAFRPDNPANALNLPAEAVLKRDPTLRDYSCVRSDGEDSENEVSDCPIIDVFEDSGRSDAIRSTTNVTKHDFMLAFSRRRDHITSDWSISRGRRSKHIIMEEFFRMLATVRHDGMWDWMRCVFGIKGPTFEPMLMKF